MSGMTCTPVNAGDNPAPDWIDARMWSEVQAVAGLPAFEGLAQSFAGPLREDFKVRGLVVRLSVMFSAHRIVLASVSLLQGGHLYLHAYFLPRSIAAFQRIRPSVFQR